MPRSVALVLLSAFACIGAIAGCATSKLAYSPDELRLELARTAPSIPRDEIVIPYEIDAGQVALARDLVRFAKSDIDRVRILTEAFNDPKIFGLRYAPTLTVDARQTLRDKEGNCLSLSSVFIGLARAAGLDAFYVDGSVRIHERRFEDSQDLSVDIGHVSVMIKTADEAIGLDFAQFGRSRWYRVISDVEALAHFYNNRGFELIDTAEQDGQEADWSRVHHNFWLAVQVQPSFAQAWNNLGVAEAHLGHHQESIAAYGNAIAHRPDLAAPHNNLGSLYLQIGEAGLALKSLETAEKLEPSGSHIQYNLAVARLRLGDRAGAIRALRQAIDLRGSDAHARSLLDELAPPKKAAR
jgi:tetratricopeptide (TPR) repeat protein